MNFDLILIFCIIHTNKIKFTIAEGRVKVVFTSQNERFLKFVTDSISFLINIQTKIT